MQLPYDWSIIKTPSNGKRFQGVVALVFSVMCGRILSRILMLGGLAYMRADLHIHTIASDGCWPPERVVTEVLERGIRLFAIADHDSVASVLPRD